MVVRSRGLPALDRPCSRSELPLLKGQPVAPGDLYRTDFVSGDTDPDDAVLEAARPLVFYGLDDAAATLKLVKTSGRVRVLF